MIPAPGSGRTHGSTPPSPAFFSNCGYCPTFPLLARMEHLCVPPAGHNTCPPRAQRLPPHPAPPWLARNLALGSARGSPARRPTGGLFWSHPQLLFHPCVPSTAMVSVLHSSLTWNPLPHPAPLPRSLLDQIFRSHHREVYLCKAYFHYYTFLVKIVYGSVA